MKEIIAQQFARMLEIVDNELGRIAVEARSGVPLDDNCRKSLETFTRILKELEKREPERTDPGEAKDLTAEAIISALQGPPSGSAPGVL